MFKIVLNSFLNWGQVLLSPTSGSMVVIGGFVGESSVDAKTKKNAGYYAISGQRCGYQHLIHVLRIISMSTKNPGSVNKCIASHSLV